MDSKIKRSIDNFSTHFQNQIRIINSISGDPFYVFNYKRILLVTLLDTISKAVYPNSNNHDRVIKFLEDFSEWNDNNRISLTHLIRVLEFSNDHSLDPLRIFCKNKISTWDDGDVIYLDRDPTYEEISPLCNKNITFSNNNENRVISLGKLKHVELFYRLRNHLVHEFRSPGKLSGDPVPIPSSPHYSQLFEELDENGKLTNPTWELQYPLPFISKIVMNCLNNSSKYLLTNNFDPYTNYDFGSYWIEGINP